MALVTNDKLKLAANSAIGGNIVAILLRQAVRLKSLKDALLFKARKEGLVAESKASFYSQPFVAVAGVNVNVRKQEVYEYKSEPTQHAVEAGASLTDHVILLPIIVDLEFEVVNWHQYSAMSVQQQLEDAWRRREPMSLMTTHKTIDDMVLVGLNCTNSLPAWGNLYVRARFQQIKQVSLEAVALPKPAASKTMEHPVQATDNAKNGAAAPQPSFLLQSGRVIGETFSDWWNK